MNDVNNKNYISIISHTEKSFVVITNNHIKYMISLKNLGGIFDAKIINKETGKTFMGWIFYIDKKEEILNWINNGCYLVQEIKKIKNDQESKIESTKQTIRESKIESKKESIKESKIENGESEQENKIKQLEKKIDFLFDNILQRITKLENEFNTLKENNKIIQDEEYEILANEEI